MPDPVPGLMVPVLLLLSCIASSDCMVISIILQIKEYSYLSFKIRRGAVACPVLLGNSGDSIDLHCFPRSC